jgi:hypothetical protein
MKEECLDVICLSNAVWGEARTDLAEAIYATYYIKETVAEAMQMDVGYI